MSEQRTMTALEIYAALRVMGLQSMNVVPTVFTMPTAYQYVPTQLMYSTIDSDAELVGGFEGNREAGSRRR